MNADEIIKVINELASRFGIAIDYTNENIMPYLAELVEKLARYKIIEFFVVSILLLALLVAGFFFAKKMYKLSDKSFDWEEVAIIYYVAYSVFVVLSLLFLLYSISYVIKWIVVPELAAYEYLIGMLK